MKESTLGRVGMWAIATGASAFVLVACSNDVVVFPAAAGTGGAGGSSDMSSTSGGADGSTSEQASVVTAGPMVSSSSGGPECASMNLEIGGSFGECVASQCCEEFLACDASPACLSIVECFRNCDPNNNSCFGSCVNQHPAGYTVYEPFMQCFGQACPNF
jgi:hypothetical protein